MSKPTYSTDGPICPYCEFEHMPDDHEYYNTALMEFECGRCRKEFEIAIDTSTSWSCWPIEEIGDV